MGCNLVHNENFCLVEVGMGNVGFKTIMYLEESQLQL